MRQSVYFFFTFRWSILRERPQRLTRRLLAHEHGCNKDMSRAMQSNTSIQVAAAEDRPLILIVEDDPATGPALKRLAAQRFSDHQVLWLKNGMAALTTVQQQARRLRLVVLDICLPVLDGRLAAAQIRALAPHVPIMPFTGDETLVPVLIELGCVLPQLKRTTALADIPARMAQALELPVSPLPNAPWVTMAQQQAQALLAFVQAADPATAPATVALPVAKAEYLKRYLTRIARTNPSRQINDVIRVLDQIV
jgi:CheY-like chemotaxis protein